MVMAVLSAFLEDGMDMVMSRSAKVRSQFHEFACAELTALASGARNLGACWHVT